MLRAHAATEGRDATTIERMLGAKLILRSDPDEAQRVAEELVAIHKWGPSVWDAVWATTPERAADRLVEFIDAGAHSFSPQIGWPYDRETIERLIGEVVPAVEAAHGGMIQFGFAVPPGDREMGRVDPTTFAADLDRLMDVAGRIFDSVWVSDHLMEGDRYRVEPWTQLTWLAARVPDVLLGPQRAGQLVPAPGADGQDVGQHPGAERRPVHPRLWRRLARGRVPGLRLPVPADPRADRPDGRGAPPDQDDVDRVAGDVRGRVLPGRRRRGASRGPIPCHRS